ncbi:hypothetical protein HA402_009510 [Bradysia odoriphaga]|nr:hypothetical protein HA402_009510 [Bradysia odoriphaga]
MKLFYITLAFLISFVWTTSAAITDRNRLTDLTQLSYPTVADRNAAVTRCTSDYQCAGHLACKNRLCKNPCDYKECATNAYCTARNHLAICSCKVGFTGNALVECNMEERCVYNPDCASDRSCREGKCVDTCVTECKNKGRCQVISHYPICDD